MIEIIRFKRGNKANLPSLQLGEPAITQDTNELYVGMTSGNVKIPTQPDLDSVNTSLAEIPNQSYITNKVSKGELFVNVKDYGAKGDGVTDDSQAFINAIAYAESLIATNLGFGADSNKLGRVTIYIPPGAYVIKSNEALMRSSFTTRTNGLNIKGAGRSITQILYQPTTSGNLMKNNDAWIGINIQDITFDCNDANSSFMDSYNNNGGAQNYSFERCNWTGTWKYGFYLEGLNNNSEMTWFHCGFYGTWDTGVYVPATGSDQFLNYNFFACQFEVNQGDLLHFEKGGNINIWGGSFIHIGSNGGTFFKLYGGPHAYGVQSFLCIGARMEHRYTTSVLIDCQWNDGTVSFISVDTSSQSQITGASTMTAVKFTSSGNKMPNVKFDNCSLMGQHQYGFLTNSWNYPHNVMYENCEMTNTTKPSDFITYSGTTNPGGKPVVKFRNCRGISNNQNIIWESDFNFQNSIVGVTQKRIVSIKDGSGQLPNYAEGNQDVWLPLNAIVTNITLFSPNGGVTSGVSGSFTVQTNETTPTVLGTVSFNPYSAGFNYSNPQFFVCDSDTKRHVTLVPSSGIDQFNSKGYCLIEYIG